MNREKKKAFTRLVLADRVKGSNVGNFPIILFSHSITYRQENKRK